MTGDVEFAVKAAQPALIIRTIAAVAELPGVFGEAYGALFRYLDELGESPAGMPYGAYHNMDMARLDLEIGVPVGRVLPGHGRIQPGELPAGEWATVLHTGPYEAMRSAYEVLQRSIAEHGKRVVGGAYEFYLSPPDVPPDEIQTIVGFPVA